MFSTGTDDPITQAALCPTCAAIVHRRGAVGATLPERLHVTPEAFAQIEALFARALELPPEEHRAFLEEHCSSAAIRQEVEALLLEDAGINHQTLSIGERFDLARSTARDEEEVPDCVGRYHIIAKIGSGGMGTVYRARQESPAREVAVKLLSAGVASAQLLRRFEFETEVLGRLQHPGIAQIYEAGTHTGTKGVQPYFAMELIEGLMLTQFVRSRKLTTRQRLELFVTICDALHHAHQKGVIHRDLKPGNILVTHSGQAKLLDFGVARATDIDAQLTTIRTHVGQLIGTLPYMSPEQVSGHSQELDVRSDVYGLGVVLYEMLSGRLPHDVATTGIYEAVRIIRDEEPVRLSSANTTLRGEIETIVRKALEKDKHRRYQSASDLAADVRRFLADEPIIARPASTWYQLRKFAKRNRSVVGSVIASFVILAVALCVSITLGLREARQRRVADQATHDLHQVVAFQSSLLSQVQPAELGQAMVARLRERIRDTARNASASETEIAALLEAYDHSLEGVNPSDAARDLLKEQILAKGSAAIEQQFADQPLIAAQLRITIGQIYEDLGLPEAAEQEARRALALWEAAGPEYLEQQQDARLAIATDLMNQSRFEEAIVLQQGVLDERLAAFGENSEQAVQAMQSLALTHLYWGRLEEGEALGTRAFSIAERVLGSEHATTVSVAHNLAWLFQEQGKLTESEPLSKRVVAYRKRVNGPEHPDTLRAMTNLAWIYMALERYDVAEPELMEILEISRKKHGEIHPQTIGAIHSVAECYRRQQRYQEAADIMASAVAGARQVWTAQNWAFGAMLALRGDLFVSLGRHAEAEPLLLEAHDCLGALLPPEHELNIRIAECLQAVYTQLGDPENAAFWEKATETK